MPARRRRLPHLPQMSSAPVPPSVGPPLRRSPRLLVATSDDGVLPPPPRRARPQPLAPPTPPVAAKRRRRQLQPPRADPATSSSSASSEEDDSARVTGLPRRTRKENATTPLLESPPKRPRTRAGAPPALVLPALARRSSPRSKPPPFALVRAPLDIIDLGPAPPSKPQHVLATDNDDNANDDDQQMADSQQMTVSTAIAACPASPPSPLTPLSTAPPSPTSPTASAAMAQTLLESADPRVDERDRDAPPPAPPSPTQPLPSSATPSDDDSMDVDSPPAPAEASPKSPTSTMDPNQNQIQEQPQSQLAQQGQGQQLLPPPSPPSPSTIPAQTGQPVSPLLSVPLSAQLLPAQHQQLQLQLPLQPQPQSPHSPQQQQAPQPQPHVQQQTQQIQPQLAMPPYVWYDIQEAQQQILHWEEPPRLELIKNVWKFACKYRVWDVICRYTPNIVRSVVAQEASDYHTLHGYPSGQFRLGTRCRARIGKRAFSSSSSPRKMVIGRKRRRLDIEPDATLEADAEEKEVEEGDKALCRPDNDTSDATETAVTAAVSPAPPSPSVEGERERFMDEEYYDWEIRSDGDEEDEDDVDEVFYYDEYDEDEDDEDDEDEGFEEEDETDSEDEEHEDGEQVDGEGEGQAKRGRGRGSRRRSPSRPRESQLGRKLRPGDMNMDVDHDSKHASREREGERKEEDDPSFNAELTLSCSPPNSPTSGGDASGDVERSQTEAKLPHAVPLLTAENSAPVPTPSNGTQVAGAVNGKSGIGHPLISMFYCPPPHPNSGCVQPQSQAQSQGPPPHAQSQPQLQAQPQAIDLAQMRPPTPVPSQTAFTPLYGMGVNDVQPLPSPTSPLTRIHLPMSMHPISLSPASPIPPATSSASSLPAQASASSPLSTAPLAPPVLPLPPPRLGSIRVRPLKYGDLGLASVVGKGTPMNRQRAGQWARAGAWGARPSTGDGDVVMGGGVGSDESQQQQQQQEQPGDVRASTGDGEVKGGQAPVCAPVAPQRNEGEDEKMRIVDGAFQVEPDQSIWDAFFATLQSDGEANEEAKQASPGAVGATASGDRGETRATPERGECGGEEVRSADGQEVTPNGASVPLTDVNTTSGVTTAATVTADSATTTTTTTTSNAPTTGMGMTTNVFGFLGMGFVSGGSASNAGSISGSRSSVSGPASPFPSPSPSISNPLYPGAGGDVDMGGVQTAYLPLSMGAGGSVSMSMSMSMGMGIGGIEGLGIGGMGVSVPMGMSAVSAMHHHAQVGGMVGMGMGMGMGMSPVVGRATTPMAAATAPAAVAIAPVATATAAAAGGGVASGPGSSALSFALG